MTVVRTDLGFLQAARRSKVWAVAGRLRTAEWGLLGLGAVLRAVQYADGRSLRLDEAFISLNLTSRSYGGLLQVLDNRQGAPPGFLLGEKALVDLFGASEYTLRLLPFVFGLAALPLFRRLARDVLAPGAAAAALALFVLLEPLVYYASDVKQYSGDVAMTVLVLSLAVRFLSAPTRSAAVGLGAAGAFALFFSHVAPFVLGGAGIALLVAFAGRRDGRSLRCFALAAAVWLATFVPLLVVLLNRLRGLQRAIVGPHSSFAMPLPPTSLHDLRWYPRASSGVFSGLIGWPRPIALLAAALCLLGLAALFRRRSAVFAMIVLPVLLALLASGLHRYPFSGRYVLFVTPLIVLMVAEGLHELARFSVSHARAMLAAPAVAVVLLYGDQGLGAIRRLADPPRPENVKPLFAELRREWRPGDRLYLYFAAQYAFRFYAENGGLDIPGARGPRLPWPISRAPHDPYGFAPALISRPPALVVGVYSPEDERAAYLADLDRLRGAPRVWILFTHQSREHLLLFVRHLDSLGRQRGRLRTSGAALYLYDLR